MEYNLPIMLVSGFFVSALFSVLLKENMKKFLFRLAFVEFVNVMVYLFMS